MEGYLNHHLTIVLTGLSHNHPTIQPASHIFPVSHVGSLMFVAQNHALQTHVPHSPAALRIKSIHLAAQLSCAVLAVVTKIGIASVRAPIVDANSSTSWFHSTRDPCYRSLPKQLQTSAVCISMICCSHFQQAPRAL